MTASGADDRERESDDKSPTPSPRGGGDLSGKGASPLPEGDDDGTEESKNASSDNE